MNRNFDRLVSEYTSLTETTEYRDLDLFKMLRGMKVRVEWEEYGLKIEPMKSFRKHRVEIEVDEDLWHQTGTNLFWDWAMDPDKQRDRFKIVGSFVLEDIDRNRLKFSPTRGPGSEATVPLSWITVDGDRLVWDRKNRVWVSG